MFIFKCRNSLEWQVYWAGFFCQAPVLALQYYKWIILIVTLVVLKKKQLGNLKSTSLGVSVWTFPEKIN